MANLGRRPSRFEVLPAPDVYKLREIANNEMLPSQAKRSTVDGTSFPSLGSLPKKSILKKTNSFTFKGGSPFNQYSPSLTPYSTITGGESKNK